MTIQQVQYILEVSQTGSISRAASNLFLAQSNLSSAIRSLEQELGFPIFTRSNRGIQPTEQGLLVLEQAGYMWECYQKMRQASAIQTTAHIRIGGAPYTPVCEAYNRLCEAYQDYERLDFSYVILPTEEMIEKLYLSLLDLGLFMVSPDAREAFQKRIASKNLVVHPIAKVPIVLRIGPKHPLYHKAEIKLSDFADYTFVDYEGQAFSNYIKLQSSLHLNPDASRLAIVPDRLSKSQVVAESTMYSIGCKLPPHLNHRYAFRNIPLDDLHYDLLYIVREKQQMTQEMRRYLELVNRELENL